MDHLIYTAYSGLSASMNQQRVIANNMANAQTTGFRAEMLVNTPTTIKGNGLEARAMIDAQVRGSSSKQGDLMPTGNPLDVAMTGDTMLAVQASNGDEAYTRRGDLSIDASGILVNGDGLPVLTESGPVTVPPGNSVRIAPDGSVLSVDPTQTGGGQPDVIGKLKLASTTGTEVEKGLDGLFRVSGGGVLPTDDNAKLVGATLEKSNVNTTQVLVDMVSAQRLFDMRSKLVATAKDDDEKSASLMALPS